MTHRLRILSAAALALAGCHQAAPSPGNDATANIATVDANAMPEDANITDVPADDGDSPAEAETNAK